MHPAIPFTHPDEASYLWPPKWLRYQGCQKLSKAQYYMMLSEAEREIEGKAWCTPGRGILHTQWYYPHEALQIGYARAMGALPIPQRKGRNPRAEIIGHAIAGNNRGAGSGPTFADRFPERYANPLTDWMLLLLAQIKAETGYSLPTHA